MKYSEYILFFIYAAAFTFYLASSASYAQDNEVKSGQGCEAAGKVIIRLDKPSFGGRVVWRRMYGSAQNDEALAVFALGNTVIGLNREEGDNNTVTLTAFDRNGRLVRQSEFPVANIKSIRNVKTLGSRAYVLADRVDNSSTLSVINEKGTLLQRKNFLEKGYKTSVTDVIEGDGSSLFVVTNQESLSRNSSFSTLYKLSSKLDTIWKREIRTGSQTNIKSLVMAKDGSLYLGGDMYSGSRNMALLTHFTQNGALDWQKPMPRGKAAEILSLEKDGKDRLFAVGKALPLPEGQQAVWVTLLDRSGETLWERFIQSDNAALYSNEILIDDVGRLAVPVESEGRSNMRGYARVILLNTKGDITGEHVFSEGRGLSLTARPSLSRFGNSTVLIATAENRLADNATPEQAQNKKDIWIAAIPELFKKENPCY